MANGSGKKQIIDRRWLYLATFLIVFIPILVTIPLPRLQVADATRGLYEAIEACPPDGIVLVDSSWDQGSLAENRSQLECVIHHLCQRKIRFVVTSVGVAPLGPDFARETITPIAREYGYEYGRDWVNSGYVQGIEGSIGAIIDGVCKDFQGTFPVDTKGTRMADMPLTRDIRSIEDFYMVYVITYAPAPEWISFVHGQYQKPVAFGAMSIMAPVYYNNLEASQIVGLMLGNRASAEYEALLKRPGLGSRYAFAGSFGSLAVILAAVLGNIMWLVGRRRARARREA